MIDNTILRKEIGRFRVEVVAEPETAHPSEVYDHTAYDIDRISRDIDSGRYWWFIAVATVYVRLPRNGRFAEHWREIGRDSLGGCLYESLDQFRSDPYCRDMVSEAIADARRLMGTLEA